jgi:hypothetical protein
MQYIIICKFFVDKQNKILQYESSCKINFGIFVVLKCLFGRFQRDTKYE